MANKGVYVILIVIGMFLIIAGFRLREQAKDDARDAVDMAMDETGDVMQGEDPDFDGSIDRAEDADDTMTAGNICIVLGILVFIVGLAGSIAVSETENRKDTKHTNDIESNADKNEQDIDDAEPDIDISNISDPEELYDLAVEGLNEGKSDELIVSIYNKALNNGLDEDYGGPERDVLCVMRFEMYDF